MEKVFLFVWFPKQNFKLDPIKCIYLFILTTTRDYLPTISPHYIFFLKIIAFKTIIHNKGNLENYMFVF